MTKKEQVTAWLDKIHSIQVQMKTLQHDNDNEFGWLIEFASEKLDLCTANLNESKQTLDANDNVIEWKW